MHVHNPKNGIKKLAQFMDTHIFIRPVVYRVLTEGFGDFS